MPYKDKNKANERIRKYRLKRKQDLIKIGGGKCHICGYDKCEAALEFHHCNPSEKLYALSNGNCRSFLADLLEVQKCVLLCSNCHREIEHNSIQLEPYINKDKAEEVAEENGYKIMWENDKIINIKKGNFCIQCGKKITNGASLCEDCYKQSLRINRPSREELKKLIRSIPFTKIGEKYNVSDNAIRKWCKTYNLPTRKKDITLISNEDWEKI